MDFFSIFLVPFQPCRALPAKRLAFSVSVFEGITEMHDAVGVGAMAQAQGVAELVHRLLHCTPQEGFFASADVQAAKGDDRHFAWRLRDPKNKIQIAGIQVLVRDRQHAIVIWDLYQSKQGFGSVLPSSWVVGVSRQSHRLQHIDSCAEQFEFMCEVSHVFSVGAPEWNDTQSKTQIRE